MCAVRGMHGGAEESSATVVVVDASALGALLFGEPDATMVAGQLTGASGGSDRVRDLPPRNRRLRNR